MKKHPVPGAHDRAQILRRDMTNAELKLWHLLRSDDLKSRKFRRQVPLGGYIADFASHDAKLVIEADGGQHDIMMEADAVRTAFLQQEGYRVIRFWNHEVLSNLEGVHALIIDALKSDHPHPPAATRRATSPIEGEV